MDLHIRVLLQKCNFNQIIQIYHPPPPIIIMDRALKNCFQTKQPIAHELTFVSCTQCTITWRQNLIIKTSFVILIQGVYDLFIILDVLLMQYFMINELF